MRKTLFTERQTFALLRSSETEHADMVFSATAQLLKAVKLQKQNNQTA